MASNYLKEEEPVGMSIGTCALDVVPLDNSNCILMLILEFKVGY